MPKGQTTGLRKYIAIRLGKGSDAAQIRKMFQKSFQARTYRAFWWYWNPTYGYFLGQYIYRPLCKYLPQKAALLLTFVACGLFLHDLPVIVLVLILRRVFLPFPITILFAILGLINIVSTKYQLTFDKIKPRTRIFLHCLTLIGSIFIAVIISKGLRYLL